MGTLCKHFDVEELLPKGCTDVHLLDKRLLDTIDQVRELLGVPCTINNWHTGGDRQWCGLRTPACNIGAPHSQHKLGRAADLHPVGMTADDARKLIGKAVLSGGLPYLGGIEMGVSWCHVDVRPRVAGKVVYFTA